jgi:pyocin large subunit-like protein
MKKYHSFSKSAISVILVTILIGATLGCSESSPDGSSLQSIVITSPPTKTVYTVGEALDISGLAVTGTYSNGTTKQETVSLSNISEYDRTKRVSKP